MFTFCHVDEECQPGCVDNHHRITQAIATCFLRRAYAALIGWGSWGHLTDKSFKSPKSLNMSVSRQQSSLWKFFPSPSLIVSIRWHHAEGASSFCCSSLFSTFASSSSSSSCFSFSALLGLLFSLFLLFLGCRQGYAKKSF